MASMSLIPFHPQEGREIVLRHHNAIVVRNSASQRLELRPATECPTCRQPWPRRPSSPDHSAFGDDPGSPSLGSSGPLHEGYVHPNYFRMLRDGRPGGHDSDHGGHARSGGAARLPRLFRPLVGSSAGEDGVGGVGGVTPTRQSIRAREPSGSSRISVVEDDEDEDDKGESTPASPGSDSEPVAAPADSSPIRKEALSPNYFKTFFVEERELGRGGKGVVLLVRHEIDGCQLGHFACKRVPVGEDHAWLEKVLVEVELLATLSHPNLVSYRHVWLEHASLTRFGPSVVCAFILQQYCNSGDLQHYMLGDRPREATKEELKEQMRRRAKVGAHAGSAAAASRTRPGSDSGPPPPRQLQFDEIYSLFRDITSGLAYLHGANYIHRDLKPSNCLLHRTSEIGIGGGSSSGSGSGSAGPSPPSHSHRRSSSVSSSASSASPPSASASSRLTCLISDFGEVQPENVARRSSGTTGTISYCAPEVLRRGPDGRYGNFTTKSDIFSLGMILYFMCFGGLPYRHANTANEDLEDMAQLRAEITDWKGFRYERRLRPDLPVKLYQLLTRLLALNPADRPAAADVLAAMRSEEGFVADVSNGHSNNSNNSHNANSSNSSHLNLSPNSALRFQNLGSPSPSSEPVPDPSKAGPPSTALALTRNHERRLSPIRVRGGVGGAGAGAGASAGSGGGASASAVDGAGLSSTATLRRAAGGESERGRDVTSFSHSHSHSHSHPRSRSPPLLMPPPPSSRWEAWYRQTVLFLVPRRAAVATTVAFALRALLFLLKMASLARPCWPFSVQWGLGASLVGMAALDLGLPRGGGGGGHLQQRQRQQHQREEPWGWRWSLFLCVLHFAAVWLASRAEVLCAGGHEAWADW